MSYSLLWLSINIKLYLIPVVQTYGWRHMSQTPIRLRPLWLETYVSRHLWLEPYVSDPMTGNLCSKHLCMQFQTMLGTSLLFRYNKLVWRPMVSDTVYVPIQCLLTRPLLTMRQHEHLLEPSARDLASHRLIQSHTPLSMTTVVTTQSSD